MSKVNEKINNHQYVLWSGEYGIRTLDLGNEDVFTEIFEQVESTTLRQIKTEYPAVYKEIERGGIDGITEDEEITVYEIDDGFIYVCDFWQ